MPRSSSVNVSPGRKAASLSPGCTFGSWVQPSLSGVLSITVTGPSPESTRVSTQEMRTPGLHTASSFPSSVRTSTA